MHLIHLHNFKCVTQFKFKYHFKQKDSTFIAVKDYFFISHSLLLTSFIILQFQKQYQIYFVVVLVVVLDRRRAVKKFLATEAIFVLISLARHQMYPFSIQILN
jgi:hypothetical protein